MKYRVEILLREPVADKPRFCWQTVAFDLDRNEALAWKGECERHRDIARIMEEK